MAAASASFRRPSCCFDCDGRRAMIAIVDLRVGNLRSVHKAFESVGPLGIPVDIVNRRLT